MVKDALLWSAVLDVDAEAMKVRRRFGWELYTLATAAVEQDAEKGGEAEEEEALGVVAASGFGGRLLDGDEDQLQLGENGSARSHLHLT